MSGGSRPHEGISRMPAFFTNPAPGAEPACLDAEPETFFPEKGGRHSAETAREVCRRCPIKVRCQHWALGQPTLQLAGIWGALSQDQRGAIRKRVLGSAVTR